jgi:FdhE protein
MTYSAISGLKQDDLRETAERRWMAIRTARPDLAPALDLQKRLLAVVLEVAALVDAGRLPKLSLPPRYLAAKLGRGVPALAAEPIPLPLQALTPSLPRLCDALSSGGAGDAATRISEAITSGQIEAGSLLAASLARNQAAIRTGAVHLGLAPDLLWLVAELAVGPFAHALQRRLFEDARDESLRGALERWDHGYCPACGSWPALAEVVHGHRTLRCSFCSCAWEMHRYACIYCGETGEKFVTAAPGEQRKDRRVEVCSGCGGYLKTIDLPELSPFPLLSISDIETTDLDLAAMEHGYQRPALREFGGHST